MAAAERIKQIARLNSLSAFPFELDLENPAERQWAFDADEASKLDEILILMETAPSPTAFSYAAGLLARI